MADPSDQIGAGLAGCGCLGALVLFVVALVSGVGFGGSVLVTFLVLLVVGYMVSLVS